MAEGHCTTISPGAPGTFELAGSPCHQAASGPPTPQLQVADFAVDNEDLDQQQLLIAGPKMQGITSKLKNVDLHNKSSHVILRNLYEATPRPGHAPSVPHANVHRTLHRCNHGLWMRPHGCERRDTPPGKEQDHFSGTIGPLTRADAEVSTERFAPLYFIPGTFRTLHLTPGAFRGTLLQALLELIAEHPEDSARCEKRLFLHRVILRTIFLPRQARDKHSEKWRKERRFVQAALHLARLPARRSDHRCGTRPCFGASLILQTISLPRLARNKHRESTLKEMRFSCRVLSERDPPEESRSRSAHPNREETLRP
jgi:hypothetical protein